MLPGWMTSEGLRRFSQGHIDSLLVIVYNTDKEIDIGDRQVKIKTPSLLPSLGRLEDDLGPWQGSRILLSLLSMTCLAVKDLTSQTQKA